MKSRTSSLDLHHLTKEFKEILPGCRLSKVYQDGTDFLFQFHQLGEGKLQLRLVIPDFIFITKYKPPYPKQPPKFCMFLRKRIGGMFLKDIRQKGFERVLEFDFEAGEAKYVMIVELFSKGNLILCDQDYKIISPFKPQSWEARTIRGGTKYEYPPEQLNPKAMGEEDFGRVLKESKMDSVVKSLAVEFGLGGTYAEEACARAGIDKDELPGNTDPEKTYKAVKEMLEESHPFADGEAFPITMRTQETGERAEGFNQAVDEVVSRELVKDAVEEEQGLKQEKVDRMKSILKQQEGSIKKLEEDAEENQRKGELLFENYQEVSSLLDQLKNDQKALSWDEIKEKYRDHPKVRQINEKEGLVVVDID